MIFAAVAATAQPVTITVNPEVRSSPAEQFALVSKLRVEIIVAESDHARAVAVANVITHLEMIPMRWPKNRRATLEAYLLQADVLLENGWTKNAKDVLGKALPVAMSLRRAGLVHVRAGEAHYRLGEGENAAKAFDLAIAPQQLADLTTREKAGVLRRASDHFVRAGAPATGADCLARAGRLDLPAIERAYYHLIAAKAKRDAGDRNGTREDAREARRLAGHARANAFKDPKSYDLLASMEREIAALLND